MKLTKNQIENLYKFTRQHYVVHYDLQTELVDHMATFIENTWKEAPEISFEAARDTSFKTFGVFGFMDVVEKRHKAMSKRYIKILWKFAKHWFTFPKLIITAFIFGLAYSLFSLNYGYEIAVLSFIILFIVAFIKGFKIRYVRKKEDLKEKLWLLEDLIFTNASVNGLLLMIQILNLHQILEGFWSSNYAIIFTAMFFTLTVIYSYVSVIVLPQQSEKLLKSVYPEYSM